jgi:hypothetical protein
VQQNEAVCFRIAALLGGMCDANEVTSNRATGPLAVRAGHGPVLVHAGGRGVWVSPHLVQANGSSSATSRAHAPLIDFTIAVVVKAVANFCVGTGGISTSGAASVADSHPL